MGSGYSHLRLESRLGIFSCVIGNGSPDILTYDWKRGSGGQPEDQPGVRLNLQEDGPRAEADQRPVQLDQALSFFCEKRQVKETVPQHACREIDPEFGNEYLL